MDYSPRLDLPYLMASQAQKHVTHNQAVRMLDCLVQPVVKGRTLTAPPASPNEGDGYIVAAAGAGAWAGKDGQVAVWQDGAWIFFAPAAGWQVYDTGAGERVVFSGSAWQPWRGGPALSFFGINATADATNRLSLKSDAALLSCDDVTPGTGDMRLKINKAAAAKTASILFQTGYSGRVEIGSTGDDKFHIKTSPDGATWSETLVADPATGNVGLGGFTSPEATATLNVLGNGTVGCAVFERVGAITSGPGATCRKARGTYAVPTAALSGDVVQNFFGTAYDGASHIGCANMRWVLEANASAGSAPTTAEFWTFKAGVGSASVFEIKSTGTARPVTDNAYTFGDSTHRWSAVWAANGTIQTSDKRDKDLVGTIAFAGAMVDALDPVLFKWKVGGKELVASKTETVMDEDGKVVPKIEEIEVPGARVHSGFLAQDIKAAMDAQNVDFAAWGLDDKDDPDSRQWTRPDQLVAVLWAALKETRAEVKALRGGA
jgi:hypothetical protein